MKTQNILLVGLAALIGFRLFGMGRAAQSLSYFVDRVSVGLEGLQPVLNIGLGVQNPSNASINVNSVVGQISVAGKQIANISSFVATDIAANAETVFPLKARLDLGGIVSSGLDLLKGQTIDFVGNINAAGLLVPVSFSQKVL